MDQHKNILEICGKNDISKEETKEHANVLLGCAKTEKEEKNLVDDKIYNEKSNLINIINNKNDIMKTTDVKNDKTLKDDTIERINQKVVKTKKNHLINEEEKNIHEDINQNGNKSKPDDNKSKPDDNKSKPDDNKSKPDDNKSKPDDNKSKPDDNKSKPDDNKSKPDDNKSKPDDNKSKPDDNKSKPDDNKSKPDDNKSKPDDNKSNPNDNKSKPDDNKNKPNDNKNKPDDNKNKPDDNKSKPNDNKSKPNDNKSKPDDNKSNPNDNKCIMNDNKTNGDIKKNKIDNVFINRCSNNSYVRVINRTNRIYNYVENMIRQKKHFMVKYKNYYIHYAEKVMNIKEIKRKYEENYHFAKSYLCHDDLLNIKKDTIMFVKKHRELNYRNTNLCEHKNKNDNKIFNEINGLRSILSEDKTNMEIKDDEYYKIIEQTNHQCFKDKENVNPVDIMNIHKDTYNDNATNINKGRMIITILDMGSSTFWKEMNSNERLSYIILLSE
ncbi:hypothetical protein PFLG_01437 [Plasmodium falciparum RAJ116]|uniref:Uncharacterized protein n=1 Tax=Plasmodium falciparum RAJ116 TaxID=580058 RepID=A0A0L0CVQ9_PLAFA|nr:hypothetical protein PFLG_01437 [Plasmodium falciparum RAJ116]